MLNQEMITGLTTTNGVNPTSTPVNWTEFDICKFFEISHGTWGAYIAILLCIVGLISNAVLVYTVTRSLVLRGAQSNAFIASVGVGNLLLLMLTAPVYVKHEFEFCWRLGVSACKFYAFTEVVAISAIAFSMVAISYERYRTTTGEKELDSKIRSLFLACIWGGAIVLAIPTVFLADLAFDNFCFVRPHFEPRGKAYILCQFLFVYMCPSVYNITIRIWAWIVKGRNEQSVDVPHHTPKQLNNATAIMSIALIIAWIPFYIFAIGLEFQTLPFGNWTVIANLYDAQYVILYFNSALTPFILWAFSGMHRASLMEDALCGAQCGSSCCSRCGGGGTGDRYSTFRNEFDLDGADKDNNTNLPRVEYSPEYEDEIHVHPNNV